MIGRVLSHFQFTAKLGRGGMGEVYLARDTLLERDVAIKVLPEEFGRDPQRLARFEREAKLLASLNHPNIAAIYQVEQADDVQVLVMEYVPGETLAERLAEGSLAVETALRIAIQIARGLESAHEKGVIHRDLKPSNIKVTPDGEVLLLDFGIAKALEIHPEEISTHARTATAETAPGAIIGTPAYMSPEQARGEQADRRADNWAFGCVLYEMLTGHRPFEAETPSESLGAIFYLEVDLGALPAGLPDAAVSVLRRCLQKDLQDRLRDIADARMELEEALQPSSGIETAPVKRSINWLLYGGWGLAAVLAIGLLVLALQREPPKSTGVRRMSIQLDGPLANTGRRVAVPSPDGNLLAYVAQTDSGPKIHVRRLDDFESRPLDGTDGAQALFFSPEGDWIGFWANQKIKKISTQGGPPSVICESAQFSGATWGADNSIVFSGSGPLLRVSSSGGTPEPLTHFEPDEGETDHEYPQFLPGESKILFEIAKGVPGASVVAVHDLETDNKKVILEEGSFPRYAKTGHILFLRSGAIFAVPVDRKDFSVTASPVPILEDVSVSHVFGSVQFAFSDNGTLVYVPAGPSRGRTLAWIDQNNVVEPLPGSRHLYYMPRVSPDGSRLVVTVLEEGHYGLWIMDLDRGTMSRLTLEANSMGAIWSPDSRRLAYASAAAQSKGLGIFVRDLDTPGPGKLVTTELSTQVPTSWSPDSETLLITRVVASGSEDIFALSLVGERDLVPIVNTKFNESGAVFSPDGKWIAYSSTESGIYQVYLRPFSSPRPRIAVSPGEPAFMPVWSRDGQALYFIGGHESQWLMRVEIEAGDPLQISAPRKILERRFGGSIGFALSRYDVAAEGDRFVFATPEETWAPTQVNLVVNWFDDVERLAPHPTD